jgi:hypothetical protein
VQERRLLGIGRRDLEDGARGAQQRAEVERVGLIGAADEQDVLERREIGAQSSDLGAAAEAGVELPLVRCRTRRCER